VRTVEKAQFTQIFNTVFKTNIEILYFENKFVKECFKITLLGTILHNSDAPGTSGIHLTLVSGLFICNKYRMAQ